MLVKFVCTMMRSMITHHQQRRVQQIRSVLQQLPVGFIEIGVLAFVFPAEIAALENIGEALAAVLLGDAIFKGEVFAGGIVFGWRGMTDEMTEIEEVFLAGGAFLQFGVPPFIDEGLRGQARWYTGHIGVVLPR